MIKIVVVDFLSPLGHKDLNKVTLDVLSSRYDIYYLASSSFKDIVPAYVHYDPLNKALFIIGRNALFNRLRLFVASLKMCMKIKRIKPEAILVMSYDTIVLFFVRHILSFASNNNDNVFLLNHLNVDECKFSSIKRQLFTKLGKRFKHLVYEDFIKGFVKDKCNCESLVLPHNINLYKKDVGNSVRESIHSFISSAKGFIIVSLSGNEIPVDYVNELIDLDSKGYLEENGISCLLKMRNMDYSSKNVCIINDYLTDDEYGYLLGNASFILLPYPVSYEYRVSGVYYDAVTFKKPIIYTKTRFFEEQVKRFGKIGIPIDRSIKDVIDNIPQINIKEYESGIEKAFDYYEDSNYLKSLTKILN